MDSADAYFLVMFVGLAALMLTLSSVGQAQALEIVLRETLPVPSEYPKLEAIRDLDGDGALDLVLWQWQGMVNPYRYYKVLEREGEGWVERFTYEQSPMRLVLVEDVDGDGRPEILSADYSSVTIHEATADNVYEVRYQSSGFGSFVEKPSAVGDSNGNRKLEFMIPREPTQVSILEGSADNT